MTILAALLLAAALETERPPLVRTIQATGATVYDEAHLYKIIRLRPGARLSRDAVAVAAGLERRYHVDGYPAAHVSGRFDADAGTLTLEIDEGHLSGVDLPGLSPSAREHALRVLAFEPGVVIQDKQIGAALERLQRESDHAFRDLPDPPYTLVPDAGGIRLSLLLEPRPPSVRLLLRGPTTASFYNRVDGLTPGLGAELTLHDSGSFNHLSVYGRASYGLTSHDPRYATGVRKPFGADHRLLLGIERHDLTDTDDTFRSNGVEEPLGKGIFFEISEDYYRRRGQEAYVLLRVSPRAHIGVTWRDDSYFSLPVLADGSFVFSRTPRPNPEIDEGRLRSLLFTVRVAAHDSLYPSWQAERESFPDRLPYGDGFDRHQGVRADASVEVADADALGGDFSFTRTIGHLHGARALGPHATLLGRVLAGFTTGTPPRQRLFALGGIGTLRGRELKAYMGDEMALWSLEYERQARWPLPGFAAFYDGGTTFGGTGVKHDVGVGIRYPGGPHAAVRVDLGVPLNRSTGESAARVTGRLLISY